MPTTQWTEPVDVRQYEKSDADKFNREVHGNLRHLYLAKAATFGRTGALVVPQGQFVSVDWNFRPLETVRMWDESFPERIVPPVGGVWLFTARIKWPAGTGARAVRMQQNGVVTIGQDTRMASAYTVYSAFSAIAVLDGMGDYVNFHIWQDGEPSVTVDGGHRLDAVWLGAV